MVYVRCLLLPISLHHRFPNDIDSYINNHPCLERETFLPQPRPGAERTVAKMGDTTPLTLPPDLPYPITITRVVAAAKDSVRRGDKMFEYTFMSATRRADIAKAEKAGKVLPKEFLTNDMVGSWESPIAGELVSWMPDIKVGMKIERQRGTLVG